MNRLRVMMASWYSRLRSRSARNELSATLVGHLLSEWFGREAVLAGQLDPALAERVERVLGALPTISLETRTQLVASARLDLADWVKDRDLVFGFVYGHAQRWCQDCGEESDWAAIFLALHVTSYLLERSWNESEVTAAFDGCFSSENVRFELGRTTALQMRSDGEGSGLPRFALAKHLG